MKDIHLLLIGVLHGYLEREVMKGVDARGLENLE